MINKSDQAYKTIGEVVKILDLKSRSGKNFNNKAGWSILWIYYKI